MLPSPFHVPHGKCPKCHQNIYSLDYVQRDEVLGNFSLDGYTDFTPETQTINFSCSECFEELFDNEEDAKEFLKSGNRF